MHGDAVQCDIAATVLKSIHVVKAEKWVTLQGNLLQTSCTAMPPLYSVKSALLHFLGTCSSSFHGLSDIGARILKRVHVVQAGEGIKLQSNASGFLHRAPAHLQFTACLSLSEHMEPVHGHPQYILAAPECHPLTATSCMA